MNEQQEITQDEAAIRAEIAAEVWGEETDLQKAPEQIQEPAAEEPEKPADPWEGVSPAVRQALDAISNRVNTLGVIETRLKQAESRIGGAERRLHEATQKVQEKPTEEQVRKAAESQQKWETLRSDFPEWAEAFDSVKNEFNAKLEEVQGKVAKTSSFDPEVINQRVLAEVAAQTESIKRQVTFTVNMERLEAERPDFREKVSSPEYKEWLSAQDAGYQNTARNSIKASDAIRVLKDFDTYISKRKTPQQIAQERKQNLATHAADAARKSTGKASLQKNEADMTPQELRKHVFAEVFKDT